MIAGFRPESMSPLPNSAAPPSAGPNPVRAGIWSPGLHLFRRLRLRAKAALICAVLLAPPLVLGTALVRGELQRAEAAAAERDALALARQLLPLLQQVQAMQGAARAVVAGQDAAAAYRDALAAARAAADEAGAAPASSAAAR
ncbi:hypothetical protein CKO43_23495, partial [Rubrivivax gelatinosus]|nr:hypothetical protein [Rubrivivax gelatinosus]